MSTLKELGKRTYLTTIGSDNKKEKTKIRSYDRNYEYKKLSFTQQTPELVKKYIEKWTKEGKEIIPLTKENSLLLKEEYFNLLNNLSNYDYLSLEIKKIGYEFLKKDSFQEIYLDTAITYYSFRLSEFIGQFPNIYCQIENRYLMYDLDTLKGIFSYIKSKENLNTLTVAFGKTPSQISNWKKFENISLKTLLEIKQGMKEFQIEEKRINTYILLIYINMIKNSKKENSILEIETCDEIKSLCIVGYFTDRYMNYNNSLIIIAFARKFYHCTVNSNSKIISKEEIINFGNNNKNFIEQNDDIKSTNGKKFFYYAFLFFMLIDILLKSFNNQSSNNA